ncbi:MAG TPA: DUF6263 family protein [Fimbriiglobus sp.]|jgi:hypothetical protein|nr:DUF6263 family protein [Fimbriiglobus sp.]
MTHLVAGLALTLALAPGDAVTLRWKLKKGDTFYARSVVAIDQTIGVPGQTMDQEQTQTTVHRYKVLEAGDKGTVLEQTIVRTEVKGNLPMADGLTDRMKGLILTYTLDPKGKVTKIEGYDAFVDKLAGDDENLKKFFKAFMSKETLKIGVQDLLGFAPDEPVKPGDTWKRKYDMSLGPIGRFVMNANCKYAGPSDGLEKVTYTADAKFSPPDDGADGGLGFTITKGDLKAEKFEGTLLFDLAAGRLKESRTLTRLGGKLTVSINGMEVELEFTQNLKATVTVSASNLADD